MIALIPARKGSKRLKDKNIKKILGKPLIVHTIEQAKKAKNISRIIVSTDCEIIARISKKSGAEVPFLRSKRLSGDKISTLDVCKYTIKKLEKNFNNKIKSFVVLQPTSPMRNSSDIDNSINLFKRKKNAVFLASIVKSKPVEWYLKLKKKNIFYNKMIFNKFKNIKYSDEFVLNGAIFIYTDRYLKENNFSKKNFYYFKMCQERSIDIDTEYDFSIAKNLMENK